MSDEDLISTVVAKIRRLEKRREADDPFRALRVDALERHYIDGATIRFETGRSQAQIEVMVDRQSAEIVSASFLLPPDHATPIV